MHPEQGVNFDDIVQQFHALRSRTGCGARWRVEFVLEGYLEEKDLPFGAHGSQRMREGFREISEQIEHENTILDRQDKIKSRCRCRPHIKTRLPMPLGTFMELYRTGEPEIITFQQPDGHIAQLVYGGKVEFRSEPCDHRHAACADLLAKTENGEHFRERNRRAHEHYSPRYEGCFEPRSQHHLDCGPRDVTSRRSRRDPSRSDHRFSGFRGSLHGA